MKLSSKSIVVVSVVLALSACAANRTGFESPLEPPVAPPPEAIKVLKAEMPRASRSPSGEVRALVGTKKLEPTIEQMTITAVDVGPGNCIVVQCPNAQEALLIDCGTLDGVHAEPSPDLEAIARRAARARALVPDLIGNRDLRIIVTHAHSDHMIFVPGVTENKRISGIWLGGYTKEYGGRQDLTDQYDVGKWLATQSKGGVPIVADWKVGYDSGGRKEPGLSCGDAEATVLTVNVPTSGGSEQNAGSLVLLLRYGNFQAVFPGDAEGTTEKDILTAFTGILKDTSLLFSAHHGSDRKRSNHESWAYALKPQTVVYNASGMHGHPHCATVQRYRNAGGLLPAPAHPFACNNTPTESHASEYMTELNGAVRVTTDGSVFEVTCSNGSC